MDLLKRTTEIDIEGVGKEPFVFIVVIRARWHKVKGPNVVEQSLSLGQHESCSPLHFKPISMSFSSNALVVTVGNIGQNRHISFCLHPALCSGGPPSSLASLLFLGFSVPQSTFPLLPKFQVVLELVSSNRCVPSSESLVTKSKSRSLRIGENERREE